MDDTYYICCITTILPPKSLVLLKKAIIESFNPVRHSSLSMTANAILVTDWLIYWLSHYRGMSSLVTLSHPPNHWSLLMDQLSPCMTANITFNSSVLSTRLLWCDKTQVEKDIKSSSTSAVLQLTLTFDLPRVTGRKTVFPLGSIK